MMATRNTPSSEGISGQVQRTGGKRLYVAGNDKFSNENAQKTELCTAFQARNASGTTGKALIHR